MTIDGMRTWRIGALVLVLGAALLAGFWFGGTLGRGVSWTATLAAAACVILGDVLGSRTSSASRIATAVAAALLFAAGWFLAGREIDRAYAECSRRGEGVRAALEEYRRYNGGFPATLDEIPDFEIPGRRLLRPGLLKYQRTGDGYVLSYRDTYVENIATHERPFFE